MFFDGERPIGGELLEDNSSFMGVSTSVGMTGSFPLLRVIGYATRPLSRTSFPRSYLAPSTHAIGHSPFAIVRHELVTLSYALLAPPVSSPCSDANGGIDVLAIGSPN